MSEKRQHVRTAFSAEVRLFHPLHGEVELRMRDISEGGLYLFTGDRIVLTVGEDVQVQSMDLADAPVVAARVVRVEPDGIALMFCLD